MLASISNASSLRAPRRMRRYVGYVAVRVVVEVDGAACEVELSLM